jgi:hypothetical protein
LEIPRQELTKKNSAVTVSSIARTAALTAYMLLLSVFFEQQDLADLTLGKEKFNYGQGSQQEEPPLFAPHLPQGS